MVTLQPLDSRVPIFQQLQADVSPVVLVNVFYFPAETRDGLLAAWTEDAKWMKAQPGFISTQLHEAIAGSQVMMNYAVWESVAAFRAAFEHPEFQTAIQRYPDGVVGSPHLFAPLAVPDVCDGV